MMVDELDDYLERARADSEFTGVPDHFTNRVMRAVRVTPSPSSTFDLLPGMVASGALVGTGAMLWLSSTDDMTAMAAAALVVIGFVWTWLEDPFSREMKVRLSPW
jgi:hypothetical protein